MTEPIFTREEGRQQELQITCPGHGFHSRMVQLSPYGRPEVARRPMARKVSEVVGADVSSDMIAESQEKADRERLTNIWFRVASATEMPFEDGEFDAVCTASLFQHVPTEMAAPIINEVMRVIRPGGIYIVQFRSGWYGFLIHRWRYRNQKKRGLRNRCLFPDQVKPFFGDHKIIRRLGYKFPGSGRLATVLGYSFVAKLNRLFALIPGVRWLGCYVMFVVQAEEKS